MFRPGDENLPADWQRLIQADDAAQARIERLREIGRKGGLANVAKHGRGWMVVIGKIGFQVMADKHWAGDRRRAAQRLSELGRIATDPMPGNGYAHFPQKEGEPW